MMRLVMLNFTRQRRTRSHQAHITTHHVKELRQFVNGQLPDHAANPSAPGVLPILENTWVYNTTLCRYLGQSLLGIYVH